MRKIISILISLIFCMSFVCAGTNITGRGFFDQNNNVVGVYIDSEATSYAALDIDALGTGGGIIVEQDGTGDGIFVNEDGDGIGLNIDSEATTNTNYGLQCIADQGARPAILATGLTTDYYAKLESNTANGANLFYRDLVSASTAGPVVFIEQDNSGDDQNALTVQNDGSGNGIYLNQNGDGRGLYIVSSATTFDNYALEVVSPTDVHTAYIRTDNNDFYKKSSQDTSAGSHWFYRNLNDSVTDAPVVRIEQDNTLDDQNAFYLQQDGSGRALAIYSYGDTTEYALDVYQNEGGSATERVSIGGGDNKGHVTLVAYRDLTSAVTSSSVVSFTQDNSGDDQDTLSIKQDGSGAHINYATNGIIATYANGCQMISNSTGNYEIC